MKFATAAGLAVLAGLLLHAQTRLGYGSSSMYGAGDASSRAWWPPGENLTLVARWNYDDPEGTVGILNSKGAFNVKDHPFFEAIGSNGRACVTCHQPADGMSLSTASIRERWTETHGEDPLFATFDGANCPDQPRAQAASHSLLLERGLIRIPLAWPPANIEPDFKLEVLHDPTGCALKNGTISVYRRPRQTANLRYIQEGRTARIMSDARERSLESQAIAAALGHLEMKSHPTLEQVNTIVAFETQVYSAQSMHRLGGRFDPESLVGNIDAFSEWRTQPPMIREMEPIRQLRMSASRGLDIFNKHCAQCHDGNMTGVRPSMAPVNIGTTTSPTWTDPKGLPVFRITCNTGRIIESTDPGRALITGRCADAGALSAQQLRGLVARAPFFVNGAANTLSDVVDYYDRRFTLQLSQLEKQDLINFLSVL